MVTADKDGDPITMVFTPRDDAGAVIYSSQVFSPITGLGWDPSSALQTGDGGCGILPIANSASPPSCIFRESLRSRK